MRSCGGEKSKPDDAADADLSLTLIALDSHHCQTSHRRTQDGQLEAEECRHSLPISLLQSTCACPLADPAVPGHGQSLLRPPMRDCLTGWLLGCLAASCLIWTPFCSVIWLNGGRVVIFVDFAQLHQAYN